MRWRMRCVTPRDESSRTLSLRFFSTTPAFSSAAARFFPLPFLCNDSVALKTDAMVWMWCGRGWVVEACCDACALV